MILKFLLWLQAIIFGKRIETMANLSTKTLQESSGTLTGLTLTTGGGSATLNASVRTITWYLVGKHCTIGGRLDLSAISAPTGALSIPNGVPFNASIDSALDLAFVKTRGFSSSTVSLRAKVLAGTRNIIIEEHVFGDSLDAANLLIAASTFIVGGTYIVQ